MNSFYHCWTQGKHYYVSHEWKDYPDGGGTNFSVFKDYKRAYRLHMKQCLNIRHMAVRFHAPMFMRRNFKAYCVMAYKERVRYES
jgi:hypothetical protein